ncbi:MAG: DUF2807 domain-containing protein [Chlorobi bacterium]|nr:DUF2807 domain-containing protein [Chlorobiota bacterium]
MSKINKILKFVSFLIIALFILNACNNSLFGLKGSGDTIKQEINLENFDKIEMAIDADVILIKGDVQKVKIEAQQNIIANIKTKVKSGKWIIEYGRNVGKHNPVTIYITLPAIPEIVLSGSGNISSDDTFDADTLILKIPGSGNIDIETNTKNVDISISGSGNIYLDGETTNQNISIFGSGNYKCFSFLSKKSDITISGSGTCEVYAQDNLFVEISGSGNVYYKGNPSINSMISGSGNIINSN